MRFPAREVKKPVPQPVPPTDWVPPADMHPTLARLVKAGKACGARLHFGEGYCNSAPANGATRRILGKPPPYRCKFHCGMILGAPEGNQNARKVLGLYANCLLPGEESWLSDVSQDDLGFEISMMKIRMRRIAEAELRYAEKPVPLIQEQHEKFELQLPPRKRGQKQQPAKMVRVENSVISKAPDFNHALAVAARQLVKTMETQALLKGKGAFSDEARKDMARKFIAECKETARSGKVGDSKPPTPEEEDV